MISYTDILKQSYVHTRRNPWLWLFGMFIVGVFNLNFFSFQEVSLVGQLRLSLPILVHYFAGNSLRLALFVFIVLLVSLIGVLVTNWSRIMLVLGARSLLENNYFSFQDQFKRSKKYIWPVIWVSVITSLFMMAVIGTLLAPLWFRDGLVQYIVWILGSALFLPLAFTIYSINIFTTFYIVVMNMPVSKALNAGTDFFVSTWTDFLGLSVVLVLIYITGFGAVVGGFGLLKLLAAIPIVNTLEIGVLHFSLVFIIIKCIVALVVWIALGALNAFFNTALLLFFLKRITPVKTEEKKEDAVPISPSPAAVN